MSGHLERPTRPQQDAGLFGPDSVTWRIHGDQSMAFGGFRALLLQAVHPLVMAGFDDNTVWFDDMWGRLQRTGDWIGRPPTARRPRRRRQAGSCAGCTPRCRRARARVRAALPRRRPRAAALGPRDRGRVVPVDLPPLRRAAAPGRRGPVRGRDAGQRRAGRDRRPARSPPRRRRSRTTTLTSGRSCGCPRWRGGTTPDSSSRRCLAGCGSGPRPGLRGSGWSRSGIAMLPAVGPPAVRPARPARPPTCSPRANGYAVRRALATLPLVITGNPAYGRALRRTRDASAA